jgi:hypothetical protein
MKLFKEDLYKKAKATEKMDWAAFARAPGNLVGSVFNIGKRIVLWPTSKLDTKVRRGVEKYHAKRSAET